MHGVKYSRGMKTAAVILQTVLTAVAAIGLSVCFSYRDSNHGTKDMLEGKSFLESGHYEDMVSDTLYDIANYIKLCSVFETNGEYDSGKFIDVESYVKRNIAIDESEAEEGVILYYLDDLVHWGKQGLNYENITVDKNSVKESEESYGYTTDEGYGDALEYTNMLEQETKNKNISISENTSILTDSKNDDEVQTIKYLDEYYLPVDGISLVDRIQSDEERQKFYEYLESAIMKLSSDYEEYKAYESKFNSENTNVHYAITDIDQSIIYTNEERIRNQVFFRDDKSLLLEDFVPYLKPYGSYFFMNSLNMSYDSSLDLENDEFLEIMKYFNNGMSGNYYVAVGIDSNFPVKDTFSTQCSAYNRIQPWYKISYIGAALSMVLSFALFVYLTFAAGHIGEDGEIVLYWFDKIKAEIAVLVMLAILGLELLIIWESGGDYQFGLWNNLIVGFAASVVDLTFLAGYLSLVRRIKKGSLWHNSLCWCGISLIAKVLKSRKTTTRTIIMIMGYLIANTGFVIYGIYYKDLLVGIGFPVILELVAALYIMRDAAEKSEILDGVGKIVEGNLEYKIPSANLHQDNMVLAKAINNIGSGLRTAVEESTRNERMKTDLITNVSHDIKTPLTSIINYVGLIKRENIQNERVQEYVKVLEAKAQRLRHLTEDLVEASKISSGNVELQMDKINFVELIYQTTGEFDEKFQEKSLSMILNMPKEPVTIMADGRRVWRVIENLYNNVAKYALHGTRVYAELKTEGEKAIFSLKNISESQLNFQADELTERFIRGDVSRSTEGSGLGLSIAKNLTELQGGKFEIFVDGDLFRVTVEFPVVTE